MKFQITGDETLIEINVIGRSHPESVDYWDGNWVTASLKIEIPGYTVSFLAHIRTDELQEFSNELKSMYKNLKGTAQLRNLDDYLHFDCMIDKLGKVTWKIETHYPPGYGAVLNFEFDSDQSYLPRLIRELDEILISFPVIGKP